MSKRSVLAVADASNASLLAVVSRWRGVVASSNAADPVTAADEQALADLLDLRDELAQRISTTAALTHDEVNAKLEVLAWMLEHQREAGVFHDGRDLGMIASIRADVASTAAAA